MDDSVERSAVVVFGNHHQFDPGRVAEDDAAGCRVLLWGVSGRGRLEHDDTTFDLVPGSFALLPWIGMVRHTAATDNPMVLGSVYLAPDRDAAETRHWPGQFDRASSELWPDLPGLVGSAGPGAADVARLGEAALAALRSGRAGERMLRAYGYLIGSALEAALTEPERSPIPAALARMQEYIADYYFLPLTDRDIAASGHCSVSTASRLFRRHTGRSPTQWLRDHRMAHATRMLETSNLRIGEIARRVGYDDPLYFSRLFSRLHGESPRAHGRRLPLH